MVIHRIEVALMPNLAGTTQRRHISLDGIRLTLRGDPMPAGTTPYIIWDRALLNAQTAKHAKRGVLRVAARVRR